MRALDLSVDIPKEIVKKDFLKLKISNRQGLPPLPVVFTLKNSNPNQRQQGQPVVIGSDSVFGADDRT